MHPRLRLVPDKASHSHHVLVVGLPHQGLEGKAVAFKWATAVRLCGEISSRFVGDQNFVFVTGGWTISCCFELTKIGRLSSSKLIFVLTKSGCLSQQFGQSAAVLSPTKTECFPTGGRTISCCSCVDQNWVFVTGIQTISSCFLMVT